MDERKACWVRFQGWAYWEDELEIRRVAGLCREILSPETLTLGVLGGRALARQKGVPSVVFDQYAKEFMTVAESLRKSNPLSGMF